MPSSMMASKNTRYLILPARGLQTQADHEGLKLLLSLSQSVGKMAAPVFSIAAASHQKAQPKIKVLDSIHENGAKLVELSQEHMMRLRTSEPGIRIVPEVIYRLAYVPYPAVAKKQAGAKLALRTTAAVRGVAASAAPGSVAITVTGNGHPVSGVKVIAFTNFAQRAGAQGVTNLSGVVRLNLPSKRVERLFALPEQGFWPFMRKNVTLSAPTTINLPPIDFAADDCVRHFYGRPDLAIGTGVKVGVIDSGIATNHPDIRLDGGQNTVTGESPSDFGDNGMEGHGTHVGGIIAARGSAPTGMRGIAPGVTLRSYRVFGQREEGASNFAIAKAIDVAVADGCDLINMSLGGGGDDPATDDAVSAARAAGVVVLAANGNDNRQPVSFPAAFDLCLAVSAMGRKGTFPANTATQDRVARPFGTDPANFIASFSNIGQDTDLTGPGVGVVSTVPAGYAVMDGTSMACPAAVGALARQLANHPEILSMSRDQARSNAIVGLFGAVVSPLGFGAIFEGNGMIKK